MSETLRGPSFRHKYSSNLVDVYISDPLQRRILCARGIFLALVPRIRCVSHHGKRSCYQTPQLAKIRGWWDPFTDRRRARHDDVTRSRVTIFRHPEPELQAPAILVSAWLLARIRNCVCFIGIQEERQTSVSPRISSDGLAKASGLDPGIRWPLCEGYAVDHAEYQKSSLPARIFKLLRRDRLTFMRISGYAAR